MGVNSAKINFPQLNQQRLNMIEIDKLNDGYYNFPYKLWEGDSTSDTSSPCVGGFNLIQHPELIEEIPEAKYSPMLKKLLIDLNQDNLPHFRLWLLGI